MSSAVEMTVDCSGKDRYFVRVPGKGNLVVPRKDTAFRPKCFFWMKGFLIEIVPAGFILPG